MEIRDIEDENFGKIIDTNCISLIEKIVSGY